MKLYSTKNNVAWPDELWAKVMRLDPWGRSKRVSESNLESLRTYERRHEDEPSWYKIINLIWEHRAFTLYASEKITKELLGEMKWFKTTRKYLKYANKDPKEFKIRESIRERTQFLILKTHPEREDWKEKYARQFSHKGKLV